MSRLQANCLLLFAGAIWGFGNVAQKTVLEHLDPLSAVGLRCLIATLLVLPFAIRMLSRPRGAGYWRSLGRVSALFSVAIVAQQVCYTGTSVTNASFLVSTATVMTPLVIWLLWRERPTQTEGLAAVTTLAGIALLSGGLSMSMGYGDTLALISALLYAFWMVELGRHMQRHGDAITAAAAQFLLAGVAALPVGLLFGGLWLEPVLAAWPELVILGVFSTAAAFGIQTIAQRYTPASHAAVIVSTESVFGAMAAAFWLGERISPVSAVGAIMVLGAIVLIARASREPKTPKPVPA